MIGLTVQQGTDSLDRLERVARSASEFPAAVGARVLPFAERRVSQLLQKEPGRVKYPIRWTSEKQRRYYFAVVAPRDSEGNVIAYQRTGQIPGNWETLLDVSRNSVEIHVINPIGAAQYVYGDAEGLHQQWFHQDTGWPSFRLVFDALSIEISDATDQAVEEVYSEFFR